MSLKAASVVTGSCLAHCTPLFWLLSGGKLSVVLPATAVRELLLEPSTSSLAKVRTVPETASVISEESCDFHFKNQEMCCLLA